MNKKILYIINDPNYFISHRLPIAIAAKKKGYEIHIAAGDPNILPKIRELNLAYHYVPLSRSGRNIFTESRSLFALYLLMKRIKPDMVHLITIKPVLYGALAARLAKVPAVIAAVTGLGYAFIDQHVEAKILRKIVIFLYKHAFMHKNLTVIFQNVDDKNTLLSYGAIQESQAVLIRGSGVDLKEYSYSPEPRKKPIVVILASRLLKDKGVLEYIEAARILKKEQLDIRFLLAGYPDPGNPSSITEGLLKEWVLAQDVEYIGYQDTATLFPQVHIVVLPSYREGLPRVLVEAAASGRAVITTDVPGCRAAITPNISGLLVRDRDVASLVDGIRALAMDSSLRKNMGMEGRKLAEKEFDIKKIVAEHLAIYRRCVEKENP